MHLFTEAFVLLPLQATCPAAEQDQIVFLNCAFSTLFVDSKEDRFPPEVFMEAKLFVTRAGKKISPNLFIH